MSTPAPSVDVSLQVYVYLVVCQLLSHPTKRAPPLIDTRRIAHNERSSENSRLKKQSHETQSRKKKQKTHPLPVALPSTSTVPS